MTLVTVLLEIESAAQEFAPNLETLTPPLSRVANIQSKAKDLYQNDL